MKISLKNIFSVIAVVSLTACTNKAFPVVSTSEPINCDDAGYEYIKAQRQIKDAEEALELSLRDVHPAALVSNQITGRNVLNEAHYRVKEMSVAVTLLCNKSNTAH